MFMFSIKKISAPILGKKKRALVWLMLASIFLTVLFYALNTFLIKPAIEKPNNFLEFTMVNYFNDFWAGVMVAAFANMIILRKNRCFRHISFYVVLFLFECVMWEVVRPFVLMLFNPCQKAPHFMWGDFVAYGLGTILIFVIILLITKQRGDNIERA